MGTVKPGWEGRYFEDFKVGDVYRCRYGRTVTENDNIWFTLLTCNTNQIHFNSEYGARTEWGKPLINSALTLAIVAGMGVMDVSENGFAMGWDEIKLPNPLFAGDTIYSESEVLEARASRSRPEQGLVKVRTRGYNQHGDVVIDYSRTVMVWKRAHAPSLDLFPTPRPADAGAAGGTASKAKPARMTKTTKSATARAVRPARR
jgi:acyl dehydratase